MSPRIVRVHPLAGVEGGRVTILGEDLLSAESGSPVPQFEKAPSRPLIATPDRIVCPIPEGASSGFLRVAWPEAAAEGPYFEVAVKLADELHPVANPLVDREGFIVTTFSTSGLGLFLGCISLVSIETMFINNTMYFVLLLFSGANIPLASMPA